MLNNDSDDYKERISSIIETHRILFATPFIGINSESGDEYRALLDFYKKPDRKKINRIISIVRTRKQMYDSGYLSPRTGIEKETNQLVRYLRSLQYDEPLVVTERRILPKNLGMSFLKKNLGVPLFGFHRPATLPPGQGLLLCYRSAESGQDARISAVMRDSRTSIEYREAGVVIDSDAPWLYCIISKTEREPRLVPEKAFRGKPISLEFSKYCVTLASKSCRTRVRGDFINPYKYSYAYLFFDNMALNTKLRSFLTRLFSGSYGIPLRDSEHLASIFIQKLL